MLLECVRDGPMCWKITLSRSHCQEPSNRYTICSALTSKSETSLSEQTQETARRPTMLDVAALAGVGLKTVSRVVNGEPGVSPALEAKVRRAIEQLHYRRDANASMLRRLGGKTQTIGLVLEDVANPFSSALHRAIEDSARARNVLVFVDRPAGHLDADSVASNNVGGSVEAVEHLLARGHRRIAFLGDLLSISTAEARLQGYRQALELAGVARDGELIRTGLRDPEVAAAAAAELLALPDPPTALFTSQNLLTIGGIRALRSAGLERRVALIGFDDVALADVLDPAVSVVAQDPQALGRSAADILFRRLDGDTSPTVHQIVPVKLIARGSGEIPPAERAP